LCLNLHECAAVDQPSWSLRDTCVAPVIRPSLTHFFNSSSETGPYSWVSAPMIL